MKIVDDSQTGQLKTATEILPINIPVLNHHENLHNKIVELPIDNLCRSVQMQMTLSHESPFYASSPNDSAYASASENSQSSYPSPSTSYYDSIASGSESTTSHRRPKSISRHERRSSNLEMLRQRNGRRGRPETKTEIYEAQIEDAKNKCNYAMLKIARNKKSSQKYRLSKKIKELAIEKNLSEQLEIESELNRKFQKNQIIIENIKQLLELYNVKY